MGNNTAVRPEEREFKTWLQRTARKLKRGELPPESWERHHSPLEESAAQRRIAALISKIAERTEPQQRRQRRR